MQKARFFVVIVAIFSMVLQPLAYGQSQKNWAEQALKEYVSQNRKLGKSLTVKEFWEKNKSKFSPEWQQKFIPSIQMQKDERLPEMEVISVKGPNRNDRARVILTLANKKTISMEFIGTQDKFLSVNGQVVSYEEFYYGQPLIDKISQDPVIKAENDRIKKMALKASMIPSYEVFSKMTPRERAMYFINMRSVLQAAGRVNDLAFKNSQKKETGSILPLLLEKAFAGPEEYAQSRDPKQWIGKKCIVAGYVGEYVNDASGTYCSSDKAIQNFSTLTKGPFKQNKVADSVLNHGCETGHIGCNPFTYGYERNGSGKSICIKVERSAGSAFQSATKQCDSRSPLRQESLAADTEAMIKTLLSKENKELAEYFKPDGKISKAKYDELNDTVVKDFNTAIEQAIATCSGFGESGQGEACTTLINRKTAFNNAFEAMRNRIENQTPPITPPQAETGCKNVGESCVVNTGSTSQPGKCNQNKKCEPLNRPPCGGFELPIAQEPPTTAPATPPPPAPVPAPQERQRCGPAVAVETTSAVEAVQVSSSRAQELPKDRRERKDKSSSWGAYLPWVLGGVIGLGAVWAGHKFIKSNQKNNPVGAIPSAPPPLPLIPQPVPIAAPQPISSTLPIPNPAVPTIPETPVNAPAGGPSGQGVR